MILVSGSFTLLARLAGVLAGKTLGWAVIVLFGRVPLERKRLLSLIALAAVAWLVALVALLVPAANRLATASVPRPGFVGPSAVGWLLAIAVLGLPAVVGAAMAALDAHGQAPKPLERALRVVRGYAFTPALAAVIVFLAVWSVARSVRALQRGWSSQEIPVIVKPRGYETVVDDLESALTAAGLPMTRRYAPAWFEAPPRLLAAVGGTANRDDLPRRLIRFGRDGLDILVYPSAVTLTGRADLVAQARAALTHRLPFSEAYLTTTKQAQEAEDWLRELFRRPFVQASDFEPIDGLLAAKPLPPDDWDALLRLRYQVEHEVLVTRLRLPMGGPAVRRA